MLTVREALALPALAPAVLVAGEGGLDNPVRWVHIVDLPQPKFEWVQGGELLLTSGYGLADDQPDTIELLAAKGLAGIVLSLGQRFEHTPSTLRAAADQHDLPIIETPPELPFIDLTEALLTEILDRQSALREQGDQIQRSLMEQVLQGNSLQQVAEALAEILGRSVTVESAAFDVLTAVEAGPVDEARMRSVREGRTSPDLAQALIERGIYARLLETRRPSRVPPMPELGMTMERIVAPVLVAQEIVGYVWIIAGDRELTELDELAIDHAATVAAVILLKEREVQRAELERRGDLLEQLLDLADAPKPALVDEVRRLGFRSDRPFQVLIIEGTPAASEQPRALPRNVERWLEEVNGPAMVGSRGEQVVVLVQSQAPGLGGPLAERMVSELSHPSLPLRVGVGAPVGELSALRTSFSQAHEALELAQVLGRAEGTLTFKDLGMFHWLRHLPTELLEGNSYYQAVRTLAAHDESHNGELLHTLETYLQAGGNATAAAGRLNLHRNTLAYRLQRIEQVLELELDQPRARFELYTAIEAYRLRGAGE